MNPQPTVLETVALPIELLAYNERLTLLPMLRNLAAASTELFQRKTSRIVPAIFLSRIVAFLALGASQRDDDTVCFLCHCQ